MSKKLFDSHEMPPPRGPRAEQVRCFEPGEVVAPEGVASMGFAVVLEGTVGIIRRGRTVRMLHPQDHLGLESTLLKQRLPYTAKAFSACRIVFYEQDVLENFMEESPRMIRSVLTSAMRQLDETSENVLTAREPLVMDGVRLAFFSDRDVVYREQERGTRFYRLVSTQGGLSLSTGGREHHVISEPGTLIGELSALLELPREHTLTSMGATALEVFDRAELESIVRDHPDVALHVLQRILLHCSKRVEA